MVQVHEYLTLWYFAPCSILDVTTHCQCMIMLTLKTIYNIDSQIYYWLRMRILVPIVFCIFLALWMHCIEDNSIKDTVMF